MASAELLKQIQAGKGLKKAVTNDRSAPVLDKPKGGGGGGPTLSSGGGGGGGGGGGVPAGLGAGPPQLGGLFANGMPKLKPPAQNNAIKTTGLAKPPTIPKRDTSSASAPVAPTLPARAPPPPKAPSPAPPARPTPVPPARATPAPPARPTPAIPGRAPPPPVRAPPVPVRATPSPPPAPARPPPSLPSRLAPAPPAAPPTLPRRQAPGPSAPPPPPPPPAPIPPRSTESPAPVSSARSAPPVPLRSNTTASKAPGRVPPLPPAAPGRVAPPPPPARPASVAISTPTTRSTPAPPGRGVPPPPPPRARALSEAEPPAAAPPPPPGPSPAQRQSFATPPVVPRSRTVSAGPGVLVPPRVSSEVKIPSPLGPANGRSDVPRRKIPSPPPNAGTHTFPVTDFPPPRQFVPRPKQYAGGRQKGSTFDLGSL